MASKQSVTIGSGSRGWRDEGGKQSRMETMDRDVVFKLGRFIAEVVTRRKVLRSSNAREDCHMMSIRNLTFAIKRGVVCDAIWM